MTGLASTSERIEALCVALGLPVEPLRTERLAAYLALLQRWNRTYNLTAVRDVDDMLVQHLADCLAVVKPIGAALSQRATRLLDVGSGGGLPGVVLAVTLPDVAITCIDTVGKKAAFVQQAAVQLKLSNLVAVHGRVEQWQSPQPFGVITSRAFSSLHDFTELTRRHLDAQGVWAAMKGRRPDQEIDALGADVEMFHVEPVHVPGLDAERCLVWMRPQPAAPAA